MHVNSYGIYSQTRLYRYQFIRHLDYSVSYSVIQINFPLLSKTFYILKNLG